MILMREWVPDWLRHRLRNIVWWNVREALVKLGYTDEQLYDWWLQTHANTGRSR